MSIKSTSDRTYQFSRIHLPLITVQICFAILPTVSKLAFKTFSPESVAFFRLVCSTLLFIILYRCCFYEKVRRIKHLLYFAVLALFGGVLNQYLFIKGLFSTTAINASIVISTVPVFTLVFGVLGREEKFTVTKLLGVGIAFAGVALLVDVRNVELTVFLKGDLLILANALSYSLYLVMVKPILNVYRPFTVITYIFVFASVEMAFLTIGEVSSISYAAIPVREYWPLLIIIFISTFLPYLLSTVALKRTYSSLVAAYAYLHPLLATSLAAVVLGEMITTTFMVAGGLILTGVALVNIKKLGSSGIHIYQLFPPGDQVKYKKKILVIKTGSTLPSLREKYGDFEHWIAAGAQLPMNKVTIVDVEQGVPLPEYAAVSGIIITGAHSMVTEGRDWMKNTAKWLPGAIERRIPTLGICFGHQLLGHALGGEVRVNPRGFEFGTVDLTLTAAAQHDPLLGGLPNPMSVQVSHTQSVVRLPDNAVLLASSAMEPHQAFVVDGVAWGVQFHPEFNAEIVIEYINHMREALLRNGRDPDALIRRVVNAPCGKGILRRFAEIVASAEAGYNERK